MTDSDSKVKANGDKEPSILTRVVLGWQNETSTEGMKYGIVQYGKNSLAVVSHHVSDMATVVRDRYVQAAADGRDLNRIRLRWSVELRKVTKWLDMDKDKDRDRDKDKPEAKYPVLGELVELLGRMNCVSTAMHLAQIELARERDRRQEARRHRHNGTGAQH